MWALYRFAFTLLHVQAGGCCFNGGGCYIYIYVFGKYIYIYVFSNIVKCAVTVEQSSYRPASGTSPREGGVVGLETHGGNKDRVLHRVGCR